MRHPCQEHWIEDLQFSRVKLCRYVQCLTEQQASYFARSITDQSAYQSALSMTDEAGLCLDIFREIELSDSDNCTSKLPSREIQVYLLHHSLEIQEEESQVELRYLLAAMKCLMNRSKCCGELQVRHRCLMMVSNLDRAVCIHQVQLEPILK